MQTPFLSFPPSLRPSASPFPPPSPPMAGPNPTPLDLMLFHKLERDFYDRLVRQLSLNPVRMKLVIALWLWLESIGHHDFIRRVSSYQHADVVHGFVREAEACLDRLAGRRGPRTDADDELPLTASLLAEDVGLRFFEYHRDQAVSGVRHFFHNVCHVIFRDVGAASSGEAAGASAQEAAGTSRGGGVALPPAPPARFMLNPMARPWSPEVNQSPEDQRSMFITFSRGHPISREDIVEFFNARYGPCLEVVMIERALPGQPPMYGRLVFTSASMIAVVLNGQRTAKFVIKGKHLWARMYVPRHA